MYLVFDDERLRLRTDGTERCPSLLISTLMAIIAPELGIVYYNPVRSGESMQIRNDITLYEHARHVIARGLQGAGWVLTYCRCSRKSIHICTSF